MNTPTIVERRFPRRKHRLKTYGLYHADRQLVEINPK